MGRSILTRDVKFSTRDDLRDTPRDTSGTTFRQKADPVSIVILLVGGVKYNDRLPEGPIPPLCSIHPLFKNPDMKVGPVILNFRRLWEGVAKALGGVKAVGGVMVRWPTCMIGTWPTVPTPGKTGLILVELVRSATSCMTVPFIEARSTVRSRG